MRGKRKEHFWTYAGVSNGNERGEWKGKLSYCDLCKRYAVSSMTGYSYISRKLLMQLKLQGSGNASSP
jgi:hypothetical protein